jgi:2-methylisocitrate lyase-like PEP mutase family enzyme
VEDIAALGGRRISIGAALARAAWAAFMRATRLIKDEGRFDGFAANADSNPLNPFFRADLAERSR